MLKDFVNQGNLVIEDVFLVKELLEAVNGRGLAMIDEHMVIFVDQFLAVLAKKGGLEGYTWQKLLMSFVWAVRVQPELLKALDESQEALDSRVQGVLRQFIEKNDWKLDMLALQDYCRHLKVLQGQNAANAPMARQIPPDLGDQISIKQQRSHAEGHQGLLSFLRTYEGQSRLQATHDRTLDSLTDHDRLRLKGEVLHPGFAKLCGLRGSRLSGGQK